MKSFRLQESPRRKAMRELYKIQPKATSMPCTSMNKVLIQESVFILVKVLNPGTSRAHVF